MPRSALALTLALAVGACTAAGGADDAGAAAMAARSGSFGVIRIERESEFDPEVSAPGAVLSAAFARYRGVDGRAVLALLGGRAADVETCRLADGEDVAFAAPGAAVDLIDVGDVEVRVAGTRTRMLARTFPDLAGVVGGVFYAEDATLGAARADVDEYTVAAEGGALPGFAVVAVAPPGFEEVLVDGVPAGEVEAIERAAGIDLAWDAGDPRDRVEIELAAAGQVLECVARDDGAFRIGAEALAWLGGDDAGRLVVQRVRTQPFDTAGLDAAWVSVASSRTVHLPVH